MAKKIYIGGIWHETHSFAPDVTTLDNFRVHKLVEGDELVHAFQGTSTEIGGALSVIEEHARSGPDEQPSVSAFPGFYAGALPSGPIAEATWIDLKDRLLQSIIESETDAIFLSLHGAMVVQGNPDPEGSLVAEIRAQVGDEVPIGVTLDFHANLGPQLVAAADVVVAYDTYPHTDFKERGAEVTKLLIRLLEGERFSKALLQLPFVPPVPAQATAEMPMRKLMALAHQLEASGGLDIVSWMAGFPYADVPRMGMSAVIIASQPAAVLQQAAESLAKEAWSVRNDFIVNLMSAEEAVSQAAAATKGPVILVDVADNVGGGSPGDGTALLAELVAQRVSGSVVSIADRPSVEAAWNAGVGSRVSLSIGGKADRFHGEPVPFEGTVRWIGDGRFTLEGDWMKGLSLDPGKSARIENDDGVSVVLSQRKVPPFDAGVLRSVGLKPEACRVIVAKSAIAWQAAYGNIAADAIYVDTPGICTPRIERLPYEKRRRPLLPFESETTLADGQIHVWSHGERGVYDGHSISPTN